ncbi:MAG: hypothetical protein ACOH2M_27150 [Cypionkella sp.]
MNQNLNLEHVRQAIAPSFNDIFGVVDLHAERIRREREASERRHEQRHAQPDDAA